MDKEEGKVEGRQETKGRFRHNKEKGPDKRARND